ncbi:MAG: hypothetical protein HKM89_08585 [Gemmatimonadales bacterium]|nr:hypothetical protein [Gemmatimonadales bacterium]
MRHIPSLLVAASLAAPGIAHAQAGHDPSRSPFRDIIHGHSVVASAGIFGGSGGDLELGPHDGTVFGLRYDIRVSGAIQFGFSIANGTLERMIQDPDDSVATRTGGPVDQSVTFAELALQFNLTGGKTWRRFAPYIGGGAGFALSSSVPQDTTEYKFGNKFFFVPHVGVRYFITNRVHLRAEARTLFWKLTYPDSFADEPAEEPGGVGDSNALRPDAKLDEWTSSTWLTIGLGFTFSL